MGNKQRRYVFMFGEKLVYLFCPKYARKIWMVGYLESCLYELCLRRYRHSFWKYLRFIII